MVKGLRIAAATLLFAAAIIAPAPAQTPTTFELFSGIGTTNYTYRAFQCAGALCPAHVPTDASGNPLTGPAGSPSTSALTMQGIAGGQPVPVSAASGALAVGAGADGWNVTEGTKADSAWSGSGSGSIVAILKAIWTALGSPFQAGGSIGNTLFGAATSPVGANPTSTLTLTSSTSAYSAGQLIANNATAGSIINSSFAIANSAGSAIIPRLRLSTNDTTSTAWGAQTIQVDLWTATPTWTNGDRAAWSPATGTGAHLGAYTCVMSAEFGDGAYAECAPTVGSLSLPKLASGTSIFWSLQAVTGSGATGASKVFTLTAEVLN